MQAYFFDRSVPRKVRLPEFECSCIVPLSAKELNEVKKEVTGDFFDDATEDDLLCKKDDALPAA